jgi:hypothetical protein
LVEAPSDPFTVSLPPSVIDELPLGPTGKALQQLFQIDDSTNPQKGLEPMSEPLKFFSEAWCSTALALRTDEIVAGEYKTVKKPDGFDHILAFEVIDRPGLITHLEYKDARAVGFSATERPEESRVWVRFRGKLEHFREAVEGSTSASNLVMRGGLKLAKGSMTDAIKNAKSMNFIMRNWWGVVPTDWDV